MTATQQPSSRSNSVLLVALGIILTVFVLAAAKELVGCFLLLLLRLLLVRFRFRLVVVMTVDIIDDDDD